MNKVKLANRKAYPALLALAVFENKTDDIIVFLDADMLVLSDFSDIFDEVDDNGNGLLEFKEFKALTDRLPHELSSEAVMDLFDRAIALSSDQLGEDMDAVTKEAFLGVCSESKLVPMEDFAFVTPQELAKASGGGEGGKSVQQPSHASHERAAVICSATAQESKSSAEPTLCLLHMLHWLLRG